MGVCVALFYVPILGNQCTVPGLHQGEPSDLKCVSFFEKQ